MQKYLQKNPMMMLLDRRMLTLIFILCGNLAPFVFSQTTLPITPEPVGSGARALGQSAFIAVADDATAASWNPAGLIQLEKPEASFVGALGSIMNKRTPEYEGTLMERETWSETEINFMSYALPIEIGNRDVVISANYHQVYGFGLEFNENTTTVIPFVSTTVDQINGKSDGAVSAYSLAGALSMPSRPELTIGASFNWYTQSLLNDHAWKVKTRTTSTLIFPFPDFSEETAIETFNNFRGYNFTLGLLWDAYEWQENLLTLGLVYHSPFTAKVDRKLVRTINPGEMEHYRHDMEIDFPPSLGAGVNYRISDALSVAFDVEWKEWSKYKQKNRDTGHRESPVDDNTIAYRLGAEHLWFSEPARESVFALRGGLFYEPRPVSHYPDPLKIYGLSTGLGWTVKEKFSLDFAYQYRWRDQDLGNIDYEIKEHLFIGSVIIYF